MTFRDLFVKVNVYDTDIFYASFIFYVHDNSVTTSDTPRWLSVWRTRASETTPVSIQPFPVIKPSLLSTFLLENRDRFSLRMHCKLRNLESGHRPVTVPFFLLTGLAKRHSTKRKARKRGRPHTQSEGGQIKNGMKQRSDSAVHRSAVG